MPRTLPSTECMLVVRTDFSDQGAWEAVRAAIGEPDEDGYLEDYMNGVEFVDDVAYRELPVEQVVGLLTDDYESSLLAVVDETTIRSPEMPIALVDLNEWNEEYGRTMRVVPAELPSIEVNVHIGNMDFFEFADNADEDGVFRGFPE
ncbi:DUF6924 domain-containing protein [Actinoallomurus sp. CA-150999]|uniref:DUF6924 domain-containing protein n=1 Tax=Actinoallomurus sp. CA-150999 TaxID=3239887 RepID=UPI003D8D8BB1